jgi:hypothetical protein
MLWNFPPRVNLPICSCHGRALAGCEDSDSPDVVGWQTVLRAEENATFEDIYRYICTIRILVLEGEDGVRRIRLKDVLVKC